MRLVETYHDPPPPVARKWDDLGNPFAKNQSLQTHCKSAALNWT